MVFKHKRLFDQNPDLRSRNPVVDDILSSSEPENSGYDKAYSRYDRSYGRALVSLAPKGFLTPSLAELMKGVGQGVLHSKHPTIAAELNEEDPENNLSGHGKCEFRQYIKAFISVA